MSMSIGRPANVEHMSMSMVPPNVDQKWSTSVYTNSHEFALHRPSNKGTKLLLKVIKAIIIILSTAHRVHHSRLKLVVGRALIAPVTIITYWVDL